MSDWYGLAKDAKNGKQLWYSQETINEAFHFLCIYSKDKEQLKPQALHTKWEKHIIILGTTVFSDRKLITEGMFLTLSPKY